MDDDAGRVDNAARARLQKLANPLRDLFDKLLKARRGRRSPADNGLPRRINGLPRRMGHEVRAGPLRQLSQTLLPEQPVDAWQTAKCLRSRVAA